MNKITNKLLNINGYIKSTTKKVFKKIFERSPYQILDRLYVSMDLGRVRRTKNIRLIPNAENRKGGKYAYSEWAHVIGIFQTLMSTHLEKQGNKVLDAGCGTGILAIASEPFVSQGGKYIGLDIDKGQINFCRSHYPSSSFEFKYLDAENPAYTNKKHDSNPEWPVKSESCDLVSALSLFTHLGPEATLFYFREVSRVLKPGGKAIITFFVLDKDYNKKVESESSKEGKYHMTAQDKWVYENKTYGSKDWRHPTWVEKPEQAIAITEDGLNKIISNTDLEVIEKHQGNWKEVPGTFFQDVLIFRKD